MLSSRFLNWVLLLRGLGLVTSTDSAWLIAANTNHHWRANADLFTREWEVQPLMKLEHVSTPSNVNGQRRTDLVYVLGHAFEWELQYHGPVITQMCRTWWFVAYAAVAVYLLGMRLGERAMRDRKAFDLKGPLNLWNLFLAVFSLFGALRTVPHLLLCIRSFGVDYTLCRSAAAFYGSGPVGFWVMLFIFSKYFELIDTVFLVVRKKNIGFLHWYHHLTVLLYCWHAFMWESPTGLYFTAMNYSVHALMYFYYFLSGFSRPRWGLLVTIVQLAQMAVGILVVVTHILLFQNLSHCDGYLWNLVLAGIMYGSYLALFAEFFYKRYCKKRPVKDATKKAQ